MKNYMITGVMIVSAVLCRPIVSIAAETTDVQRKHLEHLEKIRNDLKDYRDFLEEQPDPKAQAAAGMISFRIGRIVKVEEAVRAGKDFSEALRPGGRFGREGTNERLEKLSEEKK